MSDCLKSKVFLDLLDNLGGGQVQGDKGLMGAHEEGHRHYGGPVTLIDCIIN